MWLFVCCAVPRRTAEDDVKCYAVHAVRLSREATQYLIRARSEMAGNSKTNLKCDCDGVFVYKRRGESDARVLVVEVKHAAEVRPPRRDRKTAQDAVCEAITNDRGTAAKEYAEAVTGKAIDPSRVTLLGIAVTGTAQDLSRVKVTFDSVSLV